MGRMRLDPKIEGVLEDAGVKYQLKRGAKHYQLWVGSALVITLPFRGSRDGSPQAKNALAAVRRHIRSLA